MAVVNAGVQLIILSCNCSTYL